MSIEPHPACIPQSLDGEVAFCSERPRIWVGSVRSHDQKQIVGQWIDAAQSPVALQREIAITKQCYAEAGPDWTIFSSEGFRPYLLSQRAPLETVSALALGILEYGRAFAEWATYWKLDDAASLIVRDFREDYLGRWDCLEDFACYYLEQSGLLDRVPSELRFYLDTEAYALDLELHRVWATSSEDGGVYVFRRR